MAALGQRPAQRAQHQRGDVVDAVEDRLVARGRSLRPEVALVLEKRPREPRPALFAIGESRTLR
jgi:hypothetical protein